MIKLRGSKPDKAAQCVETIRVLLACMKRFSHNLREVDNQRFVESVEEVQRQVSQPKWSDSGFGKSVQICKAATLIQARREQEYLNERDQEFRKMILGLTRQLHEVLGGGKAFEDKVEGFAGQLDELCKIDDLRKLRQELGTQVSAIREEVENRRSVDYSEIEELQKEIKRLNANLRHAVDESMTDALTGVSNRKSLDSFLAKLVERGDLGEAQFCLLLWDVDSFKKFNDTYGHQAGDSVLKALAKQCVKMTRQEDLVARYGGEEFAIVLNGVTKKLAMKRGRQIVRAIANIDLLLTVDSQVKRVQTSISMGVSEYRGGDTPQSLIERADKALYRAKANGKNRAEMERV